MIDERKVKSLYENVFIYKKKLSTLPFPRQLMQREFLPWNACGERYVLCIVSRSSDVMPYLVHCRSRGSPCNCNVFRETHAESDTCFALLAGALSYSSIILCSSDICFVVILLKKVSDPDDKWWGTPERWLAGRDGFRWLFCRQLFCPRTQKKLDERVINSFAVKLEASFWRSFMSKC